jgi:hypothetical protein
MSAPRLLPPRPASMPRRCSRIRETYEHVPPESGRQFPQGDGVRPGGKSNLHQCELKRPASRSARRSALDKLIGIVKEREATGYAYEGADASFELLANRTLGGCPIISTVTSFRVMVERRFNAMGRRSYGRRSGGQALGRRRGDDVGGRGPTARSTRSTSRCARISASTSRRSPISNWSTTRCASSTAAPRRSPGC